jgi:hypothetical protein
MTRRRLTPHQKKQYVYDRDFVTLGWHSGTAFRKAWRRKEAFAERAFRRASRVQDHELERVPDADVLDPLAVRRRRLKKHRPPSVREVVQHKRKRRERSRGRKAASRAALQRRLELEVEFFLARVVRIKRLARPEQLRDLDAFLASAAVGLVSFPQIVVPFVHGHEEWQARLRSWRHGLLVRQGILKPRKRGRVV